MKICLIGPVYPYRGGIAHYTTMLYRALHEQGDDVLLVSFKRQYPDWLFPGQSDKDPSGSPLDVENVQYSLDSLNPITWLVTLFQIRRFQPQAIVVPWWTPFWAPAWSILGLLNRWFLKSPLVYICHNVLPHETRWWNRLIAKFVLRWGTHFVVQSEQEKARLASLIPSSSAIVFPHPVYDMFADGKIEKEIARGRLALPIDASVVLFFGIVREYKGLKVLLSAIARARQQIERLVLVVAGEFWEDKASYLALLDELGISESVFIEDRYIPNEEVALYFSAADLLVAPYLHATGSGVVQMAKGFGLPAITTQEIVDGGEGIVRVPAGDVNALSDEITAFFQGESDIKRLVSVDGIDDVPTWAGLVGVLKEVIG